MSSQSAGLATKFGYKNVRVFLGGVPAWAEAGHPFYASNEFIATGNIVLLDVRTKDKAIRGRIPRAIPISREELENRTNNIPRNAPIVLYGDDEYEVLETRDDLRNAGFTQVSLVAGNYEGWIASGGSPETGPISSTEIKWVRKLGKGEVSVADFKRAVRGEAPDTFIIDARTPEEIAEFGHFPNTVNIPLDQIPNRLSDIPKEKRILVHCSTGARAELAYRELREHGYNVKFLLLDITDAACDCPLTRSN